MNIRLRLAFLAAFLLSLSCTSVFAQRIKTFPAITAADVNERESILASDSLEGRKTGEIGAWKAAAYIAKEFKRIGLTAIDSAHNFEQPFEFREMSHDTIRPLLHGANVIGFLRGSDPKLRDEVIVIGAHYDHLGYGGVYSMAPKVHAIHYGADDNASGTTGVMELAENLASMKKKLKRSILFITFSGEEEGLIGSEYFANHPLVPMDHIKAMINMDMIGRLRGDTLIVEGVGTSPAWRPFLTSDNEAKQFHLSMKESGTGPSDQTSFYNKNLPVLFFFTGFHPDYHKPSDTRDKINAEGEVHVLNLVKDILLDLANRKEDIAFTKVAEDTTKRSTSFGVYVGGMPDYAYDGKGLKISMVTDNSPAAKAGLKANDIIIECDGKAINDIYDYTGMLHNHKPDDVVQMKVLRGKETLTIPVTLGRRSADH